MEEQEFRLGPITPEPKDFQPTQTVMDKQYIYRLDVNIMVCKRTPLHWNNAEPSGFFQIISPEQTDIVTELEAQEVLDDLPSKKRGFLGRRKD